MSLNKPKNAAELTKFLNANLPHFSTTGKAKDLRKIESDPKGKGKSVIIWYGCPSISSVTKLRVTVNFGVNTLAFGDELIAEKLQKDLNEIWSVSISEPSEPSIPSAPVAATNVNVNELEAVAN